MQKGYLTDLDRKRILACIVNMRTVCNSTFLFDKQTHFSPKLDEFAELLPELLEDEGHKIVVFSQWETMLQEAATVLDRLGYGFSLLHGGLSGRDRKSVLQKFLTNADCPVFLSTDAGGVGLNLQIADTVVNLELPWNPAVLEQRIARVHRMGQSRPVRVVNFVTRGTIEERVMKTIEQKQNLFAGIFSGDDDEIVLHAVASSTLMGAMRELLSDAKPDAAAPATARGSTVTSENSVWLATLAFLESLAASDAPPAELREQLRGAIARLGQQWQPPQS